MTYLKCVYGNIFEYKSYLTPLNDLEIKTEVALFFNVNYCFYAIRYRNKFLTFSHFHMTALKYLIDKEQ